jgi:hypothetical protein
MVLEVRRVSLHPRHIDMDVIGPWKVTRQDNGWDVELGDLVSGECMDFVLKFNLPPAMLGENCAFTFELRDRNGPVESNPASVKWTWERHETMMMEPRNVMVDRVVANRYAARARERAIMKNQRNDYEGAIQALRQVADKIRVYANHDPVLLKLLQDIGRDMDLYGRSMHRRHAKERYYLSSSTLRGKSDTGSSLRRRGFTED